MPAPRPSITPSVGAKLGKSTKRGADRQQQQPASSASSEVNSVSTIAAKERKTSVSDDDRERDADQLADRRALLLGLSTTWPLRDDRDRRPVRPRRDLFRASRPASLPSSLAGWSYWTVAKAIVPSCETWPRTSSGSGRRSRAAALDLAHRGGDRLGPLRRRAACRPRPRRRPSPCHRLGGEALREQVEACCDSVPGVEKSSEKLVAARRRARRGRRARRRRCRASASSAGGGEAR